jgi:hypothetical protein
LLVAGPGLIHARDEVALLVDLYPNAVALSWPAATADATLSAMVDCPIAHFATHGHHEQDNVLFSRLDPADGPLMAHDVYQLDAAPDHVVLSSKDRGVQRGAGTGRRHQRRRPVAVRMLRHRLSQGRGSRRPGSGSVGAEEGAQFRRVQLGLFERREVSAARGLRELDEVGGAFQPRPRRPADVGGELREAGGTSTRRACCAGGISAFARYIRMDDRGRCRAGVDTTVIALWLGHAGVRSTDAYVHADMTLKEKALALTTPTSARPGRYRPPDKVLAFLESL